MTSREHSYRITTHVGGGREGVRDGVHCTFHCEYKPRGTLCDLHVDLRTQIHSVCRMHMALVLCTDRNTNTLGVGCMLPLIYVQIGTQTHPV